MNNLVTTKVFALLTIAYGLFLLLDVNYTLIITLSAAAIITFGVSIMIGKLSNKTVIAGLAGSSFSLLDSLLNYGNVQFMSAFIEVMIIAVGLKTLREIKEIPQLEWIERFPFSLNKDPASSFLKSSIEDQSRYHFKITNQLFAAFSIFFLIAYLISFAGLFLASVTIFYQLSNWLNTEFNLLEQLSIIELFAILPVLIGLIVLLVVGHKNKGVMLALLSIYGFIVLSTIFDIVAYGFDLWSLFELFIFSLPIYFIIKPQSINEIESDPEAIQQT